MAALQHQRRWYAHTACAVPNRIEPPNDLAVKWSFSATAPQTPTARFVADLLWHTHGPGHTA